MRVVTYNIQWGKGKDEIVDLDRIARTISSADVACLQEVERNWREIEHTDQVARLAALLPDHYFAFAPSVDIRDSRVQDRSARRQYGLLTLSRWPILSTRSFPLPKYPVYGSMADQCCLQESVVRAGGQGIRIYNTHLSYLSGRQRQIQASEVMQIIADSPRQGGPVAGPGVPSSEYRHDWIAVGPDELTDMPRSAILMGDFNSRPNSREYDLIVGEADAHYGRLPEMELMSDVLTLAGVPENEGLTHPEADGTGFFRIDHVFVTGDLVPKVRRAWIDETADGSDHQPVFAELDLDDA